MAMFDRLIWGKYCVSVLSQYIPSNLAYYMAGYLNTPSVETSIFAEVSEGLNDLVPKLQTESSTNKACCNTFLRFKLRLYYFTSLVFSFQHCKSKS